MYNFPKILVSDRSIRGFHTFWGRSHGWNPLMGMKQVDPPYLYGYAIRIGGRFVGVCRERREDKPLMREVTVEEMEQIQWD